MRIPIMGRFGPVALCLAALALVSMGLIAWSHLGWRSIQERSHAFDSQLSAVQFRLHRSQWLLEEALRQPASAEDEQLISRPLEEARQMASRLAMEDSPRMQGSLTQWMQDLQRAESAVRKRWRQPADASEASVRDALAQLDGSSAALGQVWAGELELSRQRQSQLDKINMALVGGLTLVLLSAMWHAHRQRDRAGRSDKADRAGQRGRAQHRQHRHGNARDKRHGRTGERGNRREITVKIKRNRNARDGRRHAHHPHNGARQGIAIGCGLDRSLKTNAATSTGHVLD